MIDLICPDWDAPAGVRACSTTRIGGVSQAPYNSFNLGLHVGDDAQTVHRNRSLLHDKLQLPQAPSWIRQTHGTCVVTLEQDESRDADAAITRHPGQVAVIMTADCLPILLCNHEGTEVAAVHAGWRGLQAGVVESVLANMHSDASDLMAWIGPGISQPHFQVGDEVFAAFADAMVGCESYFVAHGDGYWLCDLAGLALAELTRLGVDQVDRDSGCTYRDAEQFFSYRRDGTTGRMANLIWIQPD